MTTPKPHDSEHPDQTETISSLANDWILQFVKHFEFNLIDIGSHLPPDAGIHESRLATARAVLATYLDSGAELEAIAEVLGQAVVERGPADVGWTDEMNQRRFELIDKDIQGSLTPAETIELAGLTRRMRDHVESETNLPTAGARALHRKLLQLQPTGKAQ